jgi:predicted alpha-1,2-mannosidase
MKRQLCGFALIAVIFSTSSILPAAEELSLTQFVNPFIGTAPSPTAKYGYPWDTGNVFPGAVCPRGMLAWSPDTTHARQIAGGYWYPDHKIEGFSLTHFSGRGVPCLKDIPFLPLVHEVDGSPGTNWNRFAATFSHINEAAAPGYYRVKFDDGIETELTATPRTGMARLTFPAQSHSTLLIRANGSVSIHGNEVNGFCNDKIGGGSRPYTIYFVAEFDCPFQSVKTWTGSSVSSDASAQGKTCGAILTFDTATNPLVQVRVGISYVSIENAKANLADENPTWDFAEIREKANQAWNTTLNHIQVEGGSDAEKRVFYTALYHCFMHPNLLEDVNGQYPGMDGKIHTVETGRHQYQNIPGWDQHRSLAPLIAILAPEQSSDVDQSLVNYAQQDASVRTNGGGLPRWEQVNRNSGGMVGDGDDTIISSTYAFGATHFDTKAALAAMVKGASVPGTTSDGFLVREGLKDYMKLGYVPGEAAITLEYCSDDFALAQFAKALGDQQKYITYQNRAQNWKNLFDESTGYIRPKNANGAWLKNFSPTTQKGFVEGTAAQYVWLVNFNLGSLIDKMGGDARAVARLNHFFTKLNSGLGAATEYMGNEPCEEVPWVYDFANAPERTQEVVHRIQKQLFTDQPGGIPGNDDAGALSSWYVFSALGLYPEIPGVAGFAVCSPVFPKAVIHLHNGSTIQILAKHTSSYTVPYIQSLKINDQNYHSPWIPWSALSNGATLTFNLGNTPSRWGRNHVSVPPPSFDVVKH